MYQVMVSNSQGQRATISFRKLMLVLYIFLKVDKIPIVFSFSSYGQKKEPTSQTINCDPFSVYMRLKIQLEFLQLILGTVFQFDVHIRK